MCRSMCISVNRQWLDHPVYNIHIYTGCLHRQYEYVYVLWLLLLFFSSLAGSGLVVCWKRNESLALLCLVRFCPYTPWICIPKLFLYINYILAVYSILSKRYFFEIIFNDQRNLSSCLEFILLIFLPYFVNVFSHTFNKRGKHARLQ